MSITIGSEVFDLSAVSDDGSALAPNVTSENVEGIVSEALKRAKAVRTGMGKVKGQIRQLAESKVSLCLAFRKDGHPVFNFGKLPGMASAQWAAIMDEAFKPSDTASDPDKRALTEDRIDAENAIRVELSRSLTEEAIVTYAMAESNTPQGDVRWNDAGTKLAVSAETWPKFVEAHEPLAAAIVDAYSRDGLKLPKKFGGTKSLGSGGGKKKSDPSTALTTLSEVMVATESGRLTIGVVAETIDTLSASLYTRVSDDATAGWKEVGHKERAAAATLLGIARDRLHVAGKLLNGTATDTEREKIEATLPTVDTSELEPTT